LRAAELEDKFDALRIQFEQLVHNLERSAEMEKGINDELRATSEDHISLQEKLQSLSEVFWRSTAIFGMT
jgi:predicted  nucleic acid-binding Zn-ribbon protein